MFNCNKEMVMIDYNSEYFCDQILVMWYVILVVCGVWNFLLQGGVIGYVFVYYNNVFFVFYFYVFCDVIGVQVSGVFYWCVLNYGFVF